MALAVAKALRVSPLAMLTPPIDLVYLAQSFYWINLTTLCFNGKLSCVDFMDDMGDIPRYAPINQTSVHG